MNQKSEKFVHRNGVLNKFLDVKEKNISEKDKNIKMFLTAKKEDPVEILKEELAKPLFNYNNNTMYLSRNVKKKTITKNRLIDSNLVPNCNNTERIRDSSHIDYLNSECQNSFKENSCRNQEKIFGALIRIEGFMEFCKFNGINKEELTTIIPYLQIGNYKVGEYIFKSGDNPNNFYCILKGKISILIPEIKTKKVKKEKQPFNEFESINHQYVSTPNNKYEEKLNNAYEIKKISKYNISLVHKIYYSKNSSDEEICDSDEELLEYESTLKEKEKFILTAGGCFGDWAIIYKQKRTASAKVIEDCECLLINNEIFNFCFSKKILKYENERRKFLKKKINIFDEETALFYDYFKRCTKKDEIIYTQSNSGEDFFLIYEGNFLLEKKFKNDKTDEEIVKEILNINPKINAIEKNIFKMYLNKGTFSGLEVIFNKEKKYEYTLKSISDFNVIFKINLRNFPEFKQKIMNHLNKYFRKKTQIINDLIGNKNKFYSNKIYELQKELENNNLIKIQSNFGTVAKDPEDPPKYETITDLFRKTAKSSLNKGKYAKLKRKKKDEEQDKIYNKDEILFSNVISKEKKLDHAKEKSEEKIQENVEKQIISSPQKIKNNSNVLKYEIKKNMNEVINDINNLKVVIPKLNNFEYFDKNINNFQNRNNNDINKKFCNFSNEQFNDFVNNNKTTNNSVNYLIENRNKNYSLYNFDFYNSYSKKIFNNIDSKLERVKTSLDNEKLISLANNDFSKNSSKRAKLNDSNKISIRFDKDKHATSLFKHTQYLNLDNKPMIMKYNSILNKIASPVNKNLDNFLINKTTKELKPEALEMLKNNTNIKYSVRVMHNMKNSLRDGIENSVISPIHKNNMNSDESRKKLNKKDKFKIKLIKKNFKDLDKNSDEEVQFNIKKPNKAEEKKYYKSNVNFFSLRYKKSEKLLLDIEKENEVLLSKVEKENIYIQNNSFYNFGVSSSNKSQKLNMSKLRNNSQHIEMLTKKYIESVKNKKLMEKYDLNEDKNYFIFKMNNNINSLKRENQCNRIDN